MVCRRIDDKNKPGTYFGQRCTQPWSRRLGKRLRSNGAPVYKPRPKIGQSRNQPIGVEAL